MKLIIHSARITLKGDEPEFKNVGSGSCNFIYWEGRGKHFLFYVPRLVFIKLTPAKFKKLGAVTRPTNPEPFKMAIESNRSAAATQGHWDGGRAATLLLDLLIGKAITPEEFTKIEEEPDKPLHGIYVKRAAPEPPASPEEVAAEDAAHLAKINAVNTELGAPHVSNRKTKAPTKAEVEMAKKAKKANGTKAKKATRARVAAPEGHLVVKADGNPRRDGTKAGDRFKSMKAYVGRHPKASVADVLANTSYRADDLRWDIKAKNVEVHK